MNFLLSEDIDKRYTLAVEGEQLSCTEPSPANALSQGNTCQHRFTYAVGTPLGISAAAQIHNLLTLSPAENNLTSTQTDTFQKSYPGLLYTFEMPSSAQGANLSQMGRMLSISAVESPVVTLSLSSATATVDQSLTATAEATDPDGSIVSYQWQVAAVLSFVELPTTDATLSSPSAAATQIVFAQAGQYKIQVTVTDNGGNSATATRSVTVAEPAENQAPTASFAMDKSSGTLPLTIMLDGTLSSDPDGSVTAYSWQIQPATGVNVADPGAAQTSATFNSAGTYQISLRVTDNAGLSSAAMTHMITATSPPTAALTLSGTGAEGAFNLSATDCPATRTEPVQVTRLDGNASSGAAPLAFAWRLADGAPFWENALLEGEFPLPPGTYPLVLQVTDTHGASAEAACTLNVAAAPEPVPPPVSAATGLAILIAGSGADATNTLFPYTDEVLKSLYRTLRNRGYSDDDIVYLTPLAWQDIDGDGRDDQVVDNELLEPAVELPAAFARAATLAEGAQFVFFYHGHGLQEQLKITRDYWLESGPAYDDNGDGLHLQGLLAQVPAHAEQTVIIDACYSGSLLDELAAPERSVLTAADADNPAWNAEYVSFSDILIRELRRGHDLHAAFLSAEDTIIANRQLFGEQTPQLDDDGDGVYSGRDGLRSATRVLGKAGHQGAAEPEITVHPALRLGDDSPGGVDLWVQTSPPRQGIRRVRAVFVPPGEDPAYQGDSGNFQRLERELEFNPVSHKQRWETTVNHSDLPAAGRWLVLYRAQAEDGVWSADAIGEITVTTPPPPVSLNVTLARSVYHAGDELACTLALTATDSGPYDVYAALLYPPSRGYFATFGPHGDLSQPFETVPHRSALSVTAPKTLSPTTRVREATVMPAGEYQCCGVVTAAGEAPLAESTVWLAMGCALFAVE